MEVLYSCLQTLLYLCWRFCDSTVRKEFLSLGYTSLISLSQQETDTWKTPKDQIIGRNFEPCVRRVYRYGQETEQTTSARPFLATSWAGILFPLCDVLPIFTAKTYFTKEEWAGRVVVVCEKAGEVKWLLFRSTHRHTDVFLSLQRSLNWLRGEWQIKKGFVKC